MARAQQEVPFAEITPMQPVCCGNVAITVRISGVEADIHSGADAATVEAVLRILKVMLTDFTGADRVYFACGYTDLRCGIDRLASLVQQQFNLDPIHCFCSAEDAGTESRHYTGKVMDLCCCISGWSLIASSGPGRKARQEA